MKRPIFTNEQIKEITQKHPTPFHLYDEKGIRDNAKGFISAFSWNKGFKEYFAVKALPNPTILKILKDEGCGVDCSSMTELMMADACGFSGEEIMFSSNVTQPEEFAFARKLGATINLDDISHIDCLEQNGGIPEKISMRFNPGGDFSIGTFVMGNPGDAKYGFTREQIVEGTKKLMELGAKTFGLHAFLASNTTDMGYYPHLAGILFQLAVDLHEETGANFEFVNLSGGIGIPYQPDAQPADIAKIGQGVKEQYEKIVLPTGRNINICSELGRYMTGPYGYLIAKCIHQKHIYKDYIGLDSCACDLMRPAMYGAYHHITVMGKEDAEFSKKYDVTGSLCENNDKFAVDRMLPEIEIGDILAIHDTGAHGLAMGYNYNGKLRCAEVLLKEDGSTQQIRRAEKPGDYFATLDLPELDKYR